jgi:hypothetical protein
MRFERAVGHRDPAIRQLFKFRRSRVVGLCQVKLSLFRLAFEHFIKYLSGVLFSINVEVLDPLTGLSLLHNQGRLIFHHNTLKSL